MRGARQAGMVGVLLCLLAACSAGQPGSPVAAPIEPATTAESVDQALLDLSEAAAVHYVGSLRTAHQVQATFDLTVASTGELTGSMVLGGQPATVLVVDKTLYLKAPAAFWSALSGIAGGSGKGAAIADRWVKLPPSLLGVDFTDLLSSDSISQYVGKSSDNTAKDTLSAGQHVTAGGVEAVKVSTDSGALYLATAAPHGMVQVEAPQAGNSDLSKVTDLSVSLADASATVGAFYQSVAAQAGGLTGAVDLLTSVQESGHRFDACGAASCAIIVDFTNTGKSPVTVSVRASWNGDNTPLGNCETQVGPVAPAQATSATCTLNSSQWATFYKRAHSVVGDHPYSAEWSTVVLADPVDLTSLTAHATAAPADESAGRSEGADYLYVITYADHAHAKQVWRYGVAAGKYWRDHATGQLGLCLASTRSVCSYALVTATDEPAAAFALQRNLVDSWTGRTGACPTAQWVGCAKK